MHIGVPIVSLNDQKRMREEDAIKHYARLGGQLVLFTGGVALLSKVPKVGTALTRPVLYGVQPGEEIARKALEMIPGLKQAVPGGKVDWEEITAATLYGGYKESKLLAKDLYEIFAPWKDYTGKSRPPSITHPGGTKNVVQLDIDDFVSLSEQRWLQAQKRMGLY